MEDNMYKVKTSKELDSVTASRLYNRARIRLSGWVIIKPTLTGYVVIHIRY
jgi:hypothetical protein